MDTNIAAILLAAGRSRRMGAYKPLLPFGDRTIIEACVDNFQRAGIENIIIVVPALRIEEMSARLAHLQAGFAINPDETSEMSDSIARGVEQLPSATQALFIALADQPMIPPAVIQTLLDERKRTGAQIISPQHGGRGGHPVLIDFELREELLHLDAQRGLRALLDTHTNEVLRVLVDTDFVTRDLDTWDAYQALHTKLFGVAPPVSPPSN